MRRANDERGAVTVWLAASAVLMTLVIGITVDLGGQVHAQQRARDLAAQAARVGGEQVAAPDAITGHSARVDTSSAKAAALRYLKVAGVEGHVTVGAGDTLTVHVTDSYQPVFLGSMGVGRLTVTGASTAQLVRAVDGAQR